MGVEEAWDAMGTQALRARLTFLADCCSFFIAGTAQPPAAHQLGGEIPTQIQDSGSKSTSYPAAPSAKKAA